MLTHKLTSVMTKKQFDIVLPCYNPHVGWEQKVINKFREIEKKYNDYLFRLHIVNDGSTIGYEEETINILYKEIPTVDLVLYDKNRGKGYALRQAVMNCMNDYIIYTDYDFPYTDHSFENVMNALIDGAEVVVATRGKSYQNGLPPFRRFLSISSHILNRMVLGLKIHDTQGGMKGFDQSGRQLFLSTTIDTFLFDTQFVKKASKNKQIRLVTVDAEIRDEIHLSCMGPKVIKQEMKNIFKILFE